MRPKGAKNNRYRHKGPDRSALWKATSATTLRACLATVLLIAGSLLLILGYDILTQCHAFDARRLTVTGNHRLSTGQVLARAGLEPGVNILSFNLERVRSRLVSHPWIVDAELHRELPHGIAIRIREEQPAAVLVMADKRWLVDTEGIIFKEASEAETAGLIVVEGLGYLDIPAAGSREGAPFKAVMDLFELARRPAAPLPVKDIQRIVVDREVGLTVTAFDGTKTIRLGYGAYGDKMERLKRVVDYLKAENLYDAYSAIDLNNPERAVAAPVIELLPETEQKEA